MNPLWQFILTILVFNGVALPLLFWGCNKIEQAWWEKRRHG